MTTIPVAEPRPNKPAWLYANPDRPAASVHLVCFPHAGGSARTFGGWANWLPSWLSLVRAQLPGREELAQIQLIRYCGELIQHYLTALGAWGDAPIILYGHSLGAILAFDVARAMRRARMRPPLALCVSGRRAPSLPLSHEALYRLPDDALASTMHQMGSPMSHVFDHSRWQEKRFPLMRADLEISDCYGYVAEAPLTCPILAFHGADDPLVRADQMQAWARETSSGFQFASLPGRHFFTREVQRQIVETIVIEARLRLQQAAPRETTET